MTTPLAELVAPAEPTALATRGPDWSAVKPIRWLWEGRVPTGMCSAWIGEEGVGKGTAFSWLAVQVMRGTLAGDYLGQPRRVLIIGDEDGFDQVWVPRLLAAGADQALLDDRLLTLADDFLDSLASKLDEMRLTIANEDVGLVFFDQLLDNLDPGHGGWGTSNIQGGLRAMTKPLRRLVSDDVAVLSTLHPNKATSYASKHRTFRDLVPQQFNAVFRSALWLTKDPDDPTRRVIARGKGNHGPVPPIFTYRLEQARVVNPVNRYEIDTVKLIPGTEGECLTADDILAGAGTGPDLTDLHLSILDALTPEVQSQAAIMRAVRAAKTTVGRHLEFLTEVVLRDGSTLALAARGPDGKGWVRGPDWRERAQLPAELTFDAPPV
jgi:hypothetical protein